MGRVSSDTENVEGQFKVTGCHPRLNGLSLLFGLEPWWVESFSDANLFEGQFKVIRGCPSGVVVRT